MFNSEEQNNRKITERVLILFHSCTRLPNLEIGKPNILWVKLISRSSTKFICYIYRSPIDNSNNSFFDSLWLQCSLQGLVRSTKTKSTSELSNFLANLVKQTNFAPRVSSYDSKPLELFRTTQSNHIRLSFPPLKDDHPDYHLFFYQACFFWSFSASIPFDNMSLRIGMAFVSFFVTFFESVSNSPNCHRSADFIQIRAQTFNPYFSKKPNLNIKSRGHQKPQFPDHHKFEREL